MLIDKTTVRGSPFIGIFTVITSRFLFVPMSINKKELSLLKKAGDVEVIQCFMGETSLLGIMASGSEDKLVLSELVTEKEIDYLNNQGVKTKIITGQTALGNFIKTNSKNFVASSRFFNSRQLKEIKNFLKLDLVDATVNGSELTGANMILNDNGFIVNPHATQKEFNTLEKKLGLKGVKSTINYGDVFVGNSAIANNFNVFAGFKTTGIELMRIDEVLSEGDLNE